MRRVLLRLVGVAVFTWLEFVVFPGHTYLQGDTQLSVPMLERLADPGFLSRDLLATHPNLEYTVYDEATLFLHEATGLSLENALLLQHVVCRGAGILGIILLALSAGITESLALLIAACVNLGATLTGPSLMLFELESVPHALAWGFILLAIGALAHQKPLLAGLAGGLALIYQPALAAPFWLLLIIMFIFDRHSRRLVRPALTVLAVFILLLANLAQLQPGVVEQQSIFTEISAPYAALQQFRTPYQWVSLWTAGEFWSYAAVWICGIWAVVRTWPALNHAARWFFVALPVCGALSVPVSYLLLDRMHWAFVPHIQPARWLLYTICLSAIACWIAAVRAAQSRRFWESALWLLVPVALPFRAEMLELLKIARMTNLAHFAAAVLLAGFSAWVLFGIANSRMRVAALTIPLFAIALLRFAASAKSAGRESGAVFELADWVKGNTWGSSMFLFPDMQYSNEPGLFRACSERALWVDWNSGKLVPIFQFFAATWWERWQQTMQPGYSPERLQTDLSLPIDYYVLTRTHRLENIRPVYANKEFLLYDADELRNASQPLRSARN